MGMHRSERGDASLEPVMIVGTSLLVGAVIASILRNGVLATVAYVLAISLGLAGISTLAAWADRRRLARPVAPYRWLRPQRHELLTVELPSGARLLSDGIDLVVDSTSPSGGAEAVLEGWRLSRPDRLPPVLGEAARARWASLDYGLQGRALDRWLEGIDRLQEDQDRIEEGASTDELLLWAAITPQAEQAAWWSALGQAPTPEDMGELLEAGVGGGDDAASWRRALGHRPRPGEIRSLLAAGWRDGEDALSWSEAFGRLPQRSEFAALHGAGVEGWQARQWAAAMGTAPTIEAVQHLEAAGVRSSYDAVSWFKAIGVPLTPEVLRPWQEAGIRDGADASAWRWALGDAFSPAAIEELRGVGVQDGSDAGYWARALGEAPTAARVRELVERGLRTGRQAERRMVRDQAIR